jgi:transposase
VSLPTVGLWRRNFAERRMDGLETAPRSGQPREITDDEVQRVLAKTVEPPPDETTHWSVRRLAAATAISSSTVLCADEKTQIQALDRPQPTLPSSPARRSG